MVLKSVNLKYRFNDRVVYFEDLQLVGVGRVQVKSYAGGCLDAQKNSQVEHLADYIVVNLVDVVPEVVSRRGLGTGQRDGEGLRVEYSGGGVVRGGSGEGVHSCM